MDRKTLEYMEERAKKARSLFNRIDNLSKYAEKINEIAGVDFKNISNSEVFSVSIRYSGSEASDKRFLKMIKLSLQQMIIDEIALLEQELAEL